MNLPALLLCIAFTQDPAQLIRDLDHDDIARREQASDALVHLGDPALPLLRDAALHSEMEGRRRALESIHRIERQAKLRALCPPPQTLPAAPRLETLADALAFLSREGGISSACPSDIGARGVTLPDRPMTPMEFLDRVCASSGGCGWEWVTPTLVAIRGVPTPANPTAYEGRFRFSVPTLEMLLVRQGDQVRTLLRLGVLAEHDGRLMPSSPPRIVIDQIVDDRGEQLLPEAGGDWRLPLMPELRSPGNDERRSWSNPQVYRRLNATSRSLAEVRGQAICYFALSTRSVPMSDLERVRSVRVGELDLTATTLDPGSVLISLESGNADALLPGMLDLRKLRIVDDEGNAYEGPFPRACLMDLRSAARAASHAMVTFDPTGRRRARAMNVEIATDVHEERIPFRFSGVPLP